MTNNNNDAYTITGFDRDEIKRAVMASAYEPQNDLETYDEAMVRIMAECDESGESFDHAFGRWLGGID